MGTIADDKLQELLFTSKRVSAKSAKAEVIIGVMGDPSSVPQEVHEAGKGQFTSRFWHMYSSQFKVDHLPSIPEAQEDTAELVEAVRNLAQLIVFSSAFRYILRDIFISTRAILAQSVAAVGEAASEIQIAANTVEPLIGPENDLSTTLDQQLSAVVDEAASNTAQVTSLVGKEVTDRAKAIVINRIQEVNANLTIVTNSI